MSGECFIETSLISNLKGKLHLTLMNFDHFCRYPSNVQNLTLVYQTLFFSHFVPSVQKILTECQFYPETMCRFGNNIVLESRVKLELQRIFCMEGVK
jgi:hypothetical protein